MLNLNLIINVIKCNLILRTATSVAMTLGSVIAIIIKYFQMKKSFMGSLSSQPTTTSKILPSKKIIKI